MPKIAATDPRTLRLRRGLERWQLAGFSGGLNLRDQPDVVDPSQAIDCLNVTFTQRGGMSSRDGYAAFTSTAAAAPYDSLGAYLSTGGADHIIAGSGTRLEAIDSTGVVVASSTSPTAAPHDFARFGGPGSELLFCANGTDALRQYNGSAFSVPSYTAPTFGDPTGRFVAITPWDNRLLSARHVGTSAGENPSSVRYSDPGDPLTWGENSYFQLGPGDGEQIMGMVVWGREVFVFKESAFWRAYGTQENQDGTGEVVYEGVDSTRGLAAAGAVCAARDGVYFLNSRGVYRTRGGAAELVSSNLDPFFQGDPSDFFESDTLNHAHISKARMAAFGELVLLAVPTGSSTTNNRLLVYDPRFNWWSLWDIPAAALMQFQFSEEVELLFAHAGTGWNHIGRHSDSYSTDNGTAITARWRSGWADLGNPDVKTLRMAEAWGEGIVTLKAAADYDVEPATDYGTVTVDFTEGPDLWSSDPADVWSTDSDDIWVAVRPVQSQLVGLQAHGTLLSFTVEGTEPWAINRLGVRFAATRRTSGDT